jgi:hypothetical protein
MIMARNQVWLDIERREPFAGGSSFGNTGPYERLFGKAHFAIDPDEKGLPSIVDLDLAPRNAQGLVEFSATLDIMTPVELGRGNRRILYEFSNRGNRGLMGFNYGHGTDMSKPEYAGDGFLMRRGYTLVWSGWQGDLIDRGTNVVASLPLALQDGKPLRGRVRQEFNPMAEGAEPPATLQLRPRFRPPRHHERLPAAAVSRPGVPAARAPDRRGWQHHGRSALSGH